MEKTKEAALNKLTNGKAWSFGMGFYELHENDLY